MMTNMPKRQRWLILTIGALLLLVALNQIVFTPLASVWQAHSLEIQQLKTSVASGRSIIGRGAHLQQIWTGIQSGALPRDQAQSEYDVLSAFENYGRTSAIELGSIKPLWKHGATDEYSVLECRLDATGNLPALSRFLYELERSPLAMHADSVELVSRDDTGQRLTLSLTVTALRLAPLEGKS
jgi:hypothetical protein